MLGHNQGKGVHDMATPNSPRKRGYFLATLAGFIAGAAWVIHAVLTSTNSTAVIGLMFVPVYGGGGALIARALLYVVFTFSDWRAGRLAGGTPRLLAAWAFVAAGLAWGGAYWIYRDALATASDPSSPAAALQAVSTRWLPMGHDDVEAALARNPSAPPALLETYAGAQRHYLVSLAGANPGTPPAALEKIAAGTRSYDRVAGLAGNPRITPAIAGRLAGVTRADFGDDVEYRLYQTFVLAALVRNPATPQPLFDRLAAWDGPEHFLAVAVIYAERASCAQINRAGETGSEVLRSTARSQLKLRGC